MNRALIITIGIIIILLVLGVWVYLMLFGTPKDSGEVFANLGFTLSSQQVTITPPIEQKPLETLIDTQSDNPLRQLTTRPVAGFAFVATTSTSSSTKQAVRYVERGTGHIYEINLDTGEEILLSRTTIPQTIHAVFSDTADTIAITMRQSKQSRTLVGTIGDDSNFLSISLEPNASNISFETDEKIFYTTTNSGIMRGYTHDLTTLTQTELFSMNYTNLDVSWGNGLTKIYLTTKPSKDFEGFTYTTSNNVLTPIGPSAYGLSALITNNYILNTSIQGDTYISNALAPDGTIAELPLLTLKEKCVEDVYSVSIFWCASPIETTTSTFVEDWYKGITTSNDYLWLVNITAQTAQLYGAPESLVGRTLDITNMQIDSQGNNISFINKQDQTLWLYDLSSN